MDWFDFKGVRSTDLGIHVMTYPPFILPQERVEFKPAIGKSGNFTVLQGEDVYEDILLSLYCFVEDLSNISQIATWLRGDGTLVLGNDSAHYYSGRFVNQIDLNRILRDNEHRSISLVFRAKPYKYKNPAIESTEFFNGDTITNPGNIYSEPIYKINGYGDVSLTIGEKKIDIVGLVPVYNYGYDLITIDTGLGVAYRTGSNPLVPLTGIVSRDDWPFTIPPGDNLISWTGSIDRLMIEPKWRDV